MPIVLRQNTAGRKIAIANNCRRICGTVSALLALAVPALLFVALDQGWIAAEHWAGTRFAAWLLCLAGFVCLFVSIGAAVKQRPLGVLVNERNRYSLSRLQMSLWTVLILSGLYVILLNDVYRPGEPGQSFGFNWELAVLMGASVTSVVTTPMILSRKPDGAAPGQPAAVGAGAMGAAAGALDARADAGQAGMVDLVVGEEAGNAGDIDISRIQMVMMTLVAVTLYGWEIGSALLDGAQLFLPGMPPLDETLLGLILISHAGYLSGKVTPSANVRNATAAQMGRALLVSQKATDLVRRAEQAAKESPAGSAPEQQLATLLPLLRALAVEAGTLPTQAGTGTFDADSVARLEGKVEAAAGQFALVTSRTGRNDADDAPLPDVVRSVQAQLARRAGAGGAASTGVAPTGVADAATMAAIDALLAEKQLTRADLSPQPYRMFEELQALLA